MAALLALAFTADRASPTATGPKLVVMLAVDQLRADYIEKFRHQWSSGLRRLVDRGAWFRRAEYPYMNTVTCAGHATIATGSVPAIHGMVLNEWWDRATQRGVLCTEDPEAPLVSYGRPAAGGESAGRLRATTLADEMRVQLSPSPRIVTLSMKARSAIMLAGQRGDVVLWFKDDAGWVTSRAYATAPNPAAADWLSNHPVEADSDKVWERSLPVGRYLYPDSPAGKKPPRGWQTSLPHSLRLVDGSMEGFRSRWQSSPFADEYLGRLAMALIAGLQLGQQSSTDFLGVSFSALDRIGHDFGPLSHEVQDALVRLDATLGSLLDHLDRLIGPDHYVVALSADHGVSPVPEQLAEIGIDAGRIRAGDVVDRVDRALASVLGPGKYVARLFYTDLYFSPGVYDKLTADPRAMAAALEALRATPGVAAVYRSDELTRGLYRDDGMAAAAALSYFAGRSGDLIVVPQPYWIVSSSAATHGSANSYDRAVPVVLMGGGIRPGQYLERASPADIAPTIAFLTGIVLPRPYGRVLTEALTLSP